MDRLTPLGLAAVTCTPTHLPPLAITVLGGTGKTGRRVVRRLAALGHPVRIGSRDATALRLGRPDHLAGHRRRRRCRLPQPTPPTSPSPARPSRRRRRPTAASARRAARRPAVGPGRGGRRAGRAPRARRPASPGPWCGPAGSTRTSASTSCSTGARRRDRAAGRRPCAEPFVDVDDLADVAVAALLDDGHVEPRLRASPGPRVLTFADVAAELSRGDRPSDLVRVGHAGRVRPRPPVDGRGRRGGGRPDRTVRDGARRAQRARSATACSAPSDDRPADFADYARRVARPACGPLRR